MLIPCLFHPFLHPIEGLPQHRVAPRWRHTAAAGAHGGLEQFVAAVGHRAVGRQGGGDAETSGDLGDVPPWVSWLTKAPVTIVISTINHSYWSYKPTWLF